MLRCLQGAVGGAQVVAAVQSPPDAPMTPQERPMVIKSLHSFTTYFFPSLSKIHVAPGPGDRSPSNADGANLARALCEGIPALAQQASTTTAAAAAADKGRGRDGRAWLVAEEHDMRQGESRDAAAPSVFWQADPASSGEEHKGTLYVTGTIRGGRLSADRLVHIPGWGDYAVDRIAYAPLARQTRGGATRPPAVEGMEQAPSAGQTLSEPTEEADTLVAFNEADDMLMGNEQTGFTAEELARGDAYMNNDGSADRKRVKRVPKGTSAYQAAWIIDEEEDDEFDDGDDEDDDEMDHAAGEAEFGGIGKGFGRARHDEETEEVELDERATEADDYDEELDDDEEERQ